MSSSGSGIQQYDAHLTPDQMQGYRRQTLDAGELARADRHLDACDACRRAVRALGPIALPEELSAIPEPLHLSYEQIAAYLDGKSAGAEKERAEAHLFLCASCSRELEDLRRFDLQLEAPQLAKAAVSARRPDAQLVAPVAAKPAVKTERVSIQQRLARFFAVPGLIPRLGFACAAMIGGFALLYRGNVSNGSRGGVGGAADAIRIGAGAHPGSSLGGILLLGLGLVYLLYVFFKKR